MRTTTFQLLPTTTYGTPSGNYDGSSMDFNGDPEQAADYYGGFGGLQTIAFFLRGFNGKIVIQGSLETTPASDSDWFRTYEYDTASSAVTDNFSVNVTGNFTWIRARVENFDLGSIEKLMMSY